MMTTVSMQGHYRISFRVGLCNALWSFVGEGVHVIYNHHLRFESEPIERDVELTG